MDNSMPIMLVPGLASSARIYAPVIPALWRLGPVTVANHLRDDNMAVIARVDSRPTMATIKCPTLVLTGDEDMLIPNTLSKEMADGIAGAKLVIIPECGHCPQPERPQATIDALVEWLRN